jgi:hypothetical protein
MRENHAAFGRRRITKAFEFFNQIGLGQTVKTVALNSFRKVATRNRQ